MDDQVAAYSWIIGEESLAGNYADCCRNIVPSILSHLPSDLCMMLSTRARRSAHVWHTRRWATSRKIRQMLTDSQSVRSVHARIQNVCHCPGQTSRGNAFSGSTLRSKALKSRCVLIQSSCGTSIASAGSMRYLRSRSRNARRPPSNNLHTDSRICGFSMLPP